jgi:hypothetical protein
LDGAALPKGRKNFAGRNPRRKPTKAKRQAAKLKRKVKRSRS